jgi:hypothetical protein
VVHGRVGVLEQCLELAAVARVERDADRRVDRQRQALDDHRLLDRRAHALGGHRDVSVQV